MGSPKSDGSRRPRSSAKPPEGGPVAEAADAPEGTSAPEWKPVDDRAPKYHRPVTVKGPKDKQLDRVSRHPGRGWIDHEGRRIGFVPTRWRE